jgi:ribonuclease E
MQGANFAIEKSAIQAAPQKAQDRSVVNMEWGFEGDADAEEAAEEATPAASEGEDGARRSRRRRRRGRREDRPEQRSEHRHEQRSQSERHERGSNGNASEPIDAEDVAQPGDDLDQGAELPAGLGEQPSLGRGGEDDNGERRGRRRRRGRRGGRRGRERDDPRESGSDETAAHEGNGAVAPAGEGPESFDPPAQAAASEPHERQYETASAGESREQAWRAPEPERGAAPDTEPADREPAPSATVREIQSVAVETTPDDPTRPARKGWWQRKLLG